jgi:hypothetical protein
MRVRLSCLLNQHSLHYGHHVICLQVGGDRQNTGIFCHRREFSPRYCSLIWIRFAGAHASNSTLLASPRHRLSRPRSSWPQVATADYNQFRHPVQCYAATACNRMPPLSATLCRHSIGCRMSVQNLIRAEGVCGRFELAKDARISFTTTGRLV